MASANPPSSSYLTRAELELELARMALAVMRAAPHAFGPYGVCSSGGPALQPSAAGFAQSAALLLSRTRTRHRDFVAARLRELARSSAGLNFEGFDAWLACQPAPPGHERRRTPRPPKASAAAFPR